MKKLFVQLGQWVMRHKKRLIYGALALFISQFCFFNLGGVGVENVVYAAEENQNSKIQDTLTDIYGWSALFHKLVYIFMYPILFVAGKLIDNSLVYGEAFKFDAVLWNLWVIVRNIANFGLGFIFIFKIFQFLIKGQKGSDIKKLIISALIAGVGIQASWFIMAALIDVSTIVTYGVGGLPLSVLKSDEENLRYNPYVLGSALYVDVNDIDSYGIYLTNSTASSENPKFISQCETFSFDYQDGDQDYVEELILGPRMLYYFDAIESKCYPTEKNLCHLNGDVYQFSNSYEGLTCNGKDDCDIEITMGMKENDCKTKQNKYKDLTDSAIAVLKGLKGEKLGEMKGYVGDGTILMVGNAHSGNIIGLGSLGQGVNYGSNVGLDVYNEQIGTQWGLSQLSGVIATGGYVGVFSSLYSSLMDAGMDLNFTATAGGGLYVKLLNSFLSLGHMLAIAIPLVVMLVVFMIRIGVLWMAIALSPIIVLLKVFELDEKIAKLPILNYITLKNLIPLIFSPAIICFAVSMSTVLVRIIKTLNYNDMGVNDELSKFLGGLVKLNIAGIPASLGKFVISVMGIAITWFLVWAAVKASAPKGSALGKQLENWKKNTEGLLGSIPIVPIPGKGTMMGVSTVFGGNGQEGIISRMGSDIKSKYEGKNNKAINELINPTSEKEAADRANKYRVNTYINGLIGMSDIPEDWQTGYSINTVDSKNNTITTRFADLASGDQEKVIDKINEIESVEKRKAFAKRPITIDGKTYTFVAEKDGKQVNKIQPS